MNAWETLAADCDQATEKCSWCRKYGHNMPMCPEYKAWHEQIKIVRIQPVRGTLSSLFWGSLLWAAIFVVSWMFWKELAR